jgi:ubiquinone/menaquinone biosynthesis C-methylase UbiE
VTTAPENPFAAADVGAVYARGRPYHHPRTLTRVLMLVGDEPVRRALDVACGTGMSTTALGGIAGTVAGVDLSPEMLRAAAPLGNGGYLLGRAERLPFRDAAFDAVTCSSGVHWFDQPRFYAELHRVLAPHAWVGLYDHYFVDMPGVGDFRAWAADLFARYPLPERNLQVGDPANEVPDGFELVATDLYEDPIEMTAQEFVDYQLTISHCVAAVERGTARSDVRAWLEASIAPLFAGERARVLRFLGSVTCLRRVP